MSRFALAACMLSAFCGALLLACGPKDDGPCAALLATCFANQQICVADSGTPQCQPCADGKYAASDGTCQPIPGMALVHTFADFTTQPGDEVKGLCQSWTLGNDTELWVSTVELAQNAASHHSNWTFSPETKYPGDDGVWPCSDRNYNERDAALAGGVLYAQSTQATHEVQHFPNSAATRVPPHSRIIGDVHLLNATTQSVTGHTTLTLYTLPADEVKVKLAPFHLDYLALQIPPHAQSRFTGDCSVYQDFQVTYGTNVQMQIYYLLPHTHSLATRFFVDVMGGPRDGQHVIQIEGFNSEAHGRAYDPPWDMSDADGFRFGCDYDNPRAVEVDWGFGDQEMCEVLGFADSKLAFEGLVETTKAEGNDATTQLFGGNCVTLPFKYDGGPTGP
jgi:hypothetical protein